ncbi:MAG: aldehyde dehydrogenase family protein [Candidatus Brocadiales bacterium]|nr:aldehyde dehydrogenase family protein [Candidatus Bathyanammoxibius sp.]
MVIKLYPASKKKSESGAKSSAKIKPGKMLIDGKWVNSRSGKTLKTINPATGKVITSIACGDRRDVNLAVKAARRAFESGPWPAMDARDRGRILANVAKLVEDNHEELARLETLDNGKPIKESRAVDVPYTADTFFYYAGWADKIHGETIPVRGDMLNYTLREPVGVIGQIIPWNFPLLMAAWKLGPALACGNTVVLKPAEDTSLSALRLGELFMEAGLPAGVLNIVTGLGETAGAALARHVDVDKVAFTGSTTVGKDIVRASADTLKKVSLELGGKSPNIIFADADIEAAVQGALMGIFFNQGEVCCAGSRLYVEKKIHDKFMDRMVSFASKMRVGDPFNPRTDMGALVSQVQFDKVMGYIEAGKEEGAELCCGGEALKSNGYFIKPTIFDNVKGTMKIAREEIFGPVVSTFTFRNIDEVVRAGNQSRYGLAAAVWTRDIQKAHAVARRLRAGTVWINTYNAFDCGSPFGGYKESGYGRELGEHSLELYTQVKSVWVNLS